MTDSDEIRMPDASKEEAGFAVVGAIASLLPFVGGPVATGVAYAGQRRMNERLKAHFDAVERKFAAFQVQIDSLSESGWSTAFHAAQAAARTHRQEKHDALLNATLNAALPGAPNDDLQHIFVSIVDEFAPVHLRLLAVMLHPEQFDSDIPDYRALLGFQLKTPERAWNLLTTHVSPRRGLIESLLNDRDCSGRTIVEGTSSTWTRMKVVMVAVRQREKPPRCVAETGVWISTGLPDLPTCILPAAARKPSWMRECYIPGPPEQSPMTL